MIVVDPGVGTDRLPLAVSAGDYIFICPDNGVLSLFLQQHSMEEARIISHPSCRLEPTSSTFHGRDIFAPAAARLASGFPLSRIGKSVSEIARLDLAKPIREADGTIHGQIIHVDHFGNLISNISQSLFGEERIESKVGIEFNGNSLNFIARSYESVPAGETLALWDSFNFLEIAVNRGNAAETLGISVGDNVILTPAPEGNSNIKE